VSIWGQSAGAGSVVAQVIANSGKTSPPLFSRALASSRHFGRRRINMMLLKAQAIYDTLANLTGCAGTEDSLKCLKSVDVQTIREAAVCRFQGARRMRVVLILGRRLLMGSS
jgi:carboxylesterase type B